MTKVEILCGNASDNLYMTFKGGCRKSLTYQECYRCTGCGGRFHKDCILEHFKLEESHDWGRQQEREKLEAHTAKAAVEARIDERKNIPAHAADYGFERLDLVVEYQDGTNSGVLPYREAWNAAYDRFINTNDARIVELKQQGPTNAK